MDRPFGAAVFDRGSCSLRPSLYAKVLNSRAFFALQITTPRGKLQQNNQFDCVIQPIPDADI
jgi:hypothetical protein